MNKEINELKNCKPEHRSETTPVDLVKFTSISLINIIKDEKNSDEKKLSERFIFS